MDKKFEQLLENARLGRKLKNKDIIALLLVGPEKQSELFELADRVRRFYLGDEVHLRGIIEFSNYCVRQCHYCGLRAANTEVKRYRLTEEVIVSSARKAAQLGFKTVVLQSGEDPFYSVERLTRIIQRIKKDTGLTVTMSVGERSFDDYHRMREAGAERYLLKQETSDPRLFAKLRPQTTLDGRIQRLKWLKKLGYQTGSGNMVGLPGQTLETLAQDLQLMRDLDVDMAGIGPFIPHHQTPLAGNPGGTLGMTLKVLAVARIIMPSVNLPATTALETIHARGRRLALQCGANVIMPNITPVACRRHYSIYPNKAGTNEGLEEILAAIKNLLRELGREIGTGFGDRRNVVMGRGLSNGNSQCRFY